MREMRSFTVAFLILLATCSIPSTAWAGPGGSRRTRPNRDQSIEQVNEAFSRYVDGWTRGDLRVLDGVYATDDRLVLFWPDIKYPWRIKGYTAARKRLDEIFKNMSLMGGLKLDFYEREIELYGHIAIFTSHWKWLNVPEEVKDLFSGGRVTLVFEHRGPRWVIVHEHASWKPPDIEQADPRRRKPKTDDKKPM